MQTVFISDLHLEPARDDISSQFIEYIESLGTETERLYIVGDLFEAWVGDDAPGPLGLQVIEHLARLTRRGVHGFFTHGNRDFLIGSEFLKQTGFTLLDEETVIDCYGTQVLLMHGDSLCTDDVAYQALRSVVRDPHWQADILAKSVAQRVALAREMRLQSSVQMQQKETAIMDVNQQEVEAVMRRHQVNFLLHGHTHRPNVHKFTLDGQPAQRIVLGDWYEQGSTVRWDKNGFELLELRR
ncbi:MAG: UDP-2,3-diacylglucosamine diphosphatase [Gammaproteobacteria bacterium]|nr:UDP-2,3-diacylglucosamine diphosphatase [Gammaproteobacteria bacterium]